MNNILEASSSNNQPTKDGSDNKRRKKYLDCSNSASKVCMIHGARNSSDECKVLGKFVTKYAAPQPTKDCGSDTIPRERFQKNKRTKLLLTTWWMNSAWLNPKM